MFRVAISNPVNSCHCNSENFPLGAACNHCQDVYIGEAEVRDYLDHTVGYYRTYVEACEAAEHIIIIN